MQAVFLALLVVATASAASAELIPYEATLQIDVSVGQALQSDRRIVDATFSGLADVDAGVVFIAAGDLSTPVATGDGFGGTLVNGALTFSIGGAVPGAACPPLLLAIQERCIAGSGFGGVMPLLGITQHGQALDAWGAGVITTGMTSMGLTRTVSGTNWTTGTGEAWFYIPEIDPTPFLLSGMGSFAGLPSTDTLPGEFGFRAVTPMVVTGSQVSSLPNTRGLATLTVRFPVNPVPLWIGTGLAAAITVVGFLRLRARRVSSAR